LYLILFISLSNNDIIIDGFAYYLGNFDIIVSNPPYIPSREMLTLEPEVIHNEDHRALHGGSDGLEIVKEAIFIFIYCFIIYLLLIYIRHILFRYYNLDHFY
jgi:hypothetical protein